MYIATNGFTTKDPNLSGDLHDEQTKGAETWLYTKLCKRNWLHFQLRFFVTWSLRKYLIFDKTLDKILHFRYTHTRAVKLSWIFPEAPLTFNGACGNIQGKLNRPVCYTELTFCDTPLRSSDMKQCHILLTLKSFSSVQLFRLWIELF